MYESFTQRARKVLRLADGEARRLNHEYIGTEHILLGLIKEGSGVAANVLKNLDVGLRNIRIEVEKLVQSGPDMIAVGKLPLTPRAKKVFEYAEEESRMLNHNYVGTEHILHGLLFECEGVAAQVLTQLGLTLENVRAEVTKIIGQVSSETLPTADLQNDLVLLKTALGDPSLNDVDAIRCATRYVVFFEKIRKGIP
jgi:ATP-dependent Clp protease ATP-binding subunit ClpC